MLKKSNETTIKQFNKKFCDQKNPEKNLLLSKNIAMTHDFSITKRRNNVLALGVGSIKEGIPSIITENMRNSDQNFIVLDENHQILNETKDMLVQRGYQIKEYPDEMKENEKMTFFIQADNENADQFMSEILQLSMSCREENKQKKHRINVILSMELIKKYKLNFFAAHQSSYYILHKYGIDCICTTDFVEDAFSLFDGSSISLQLTHDFFDQYVFFGGKVLRKDIQRETAEYELLLHCDMKEGTDCYERLFLLKTLPVGKCAVIVCKQDFMIDNVL
ncbi:hypothetical protein [Anaerostipes hadrus]|jgi:hypothetical protein|uniref:hypothetical protein n=1 Tax=Anaerostipes hadrus TaxID=649756 RepID=UPI0032C08791